MGDKEDLIEEAKKTVREDYDLIIGVTGKKGNGKSALVNDQIAPAIDEHFDLDKNVGYIPSYEDIRNKFNQVHRYGCLSIDEAAKAFYKLNFMNALQGEVSKFYMTNRKGNNKITFLLIPSFHDLTRQFRKEQIGVWIYVIARGYAIVYFRDNDKDIDDPWHTDENIKIKKKIYGTDSLSERTFEEELEAERETINYVGEFEFPDWKPESKKRYDELVTKYANVKVEESTKQELYKFWRQKATNLMHYFKEYVPNVSQEEIGRMLNMSQKTVSNLFHYKPEMTEDQIKSTILEISQRTEDDDLEKKAIAIKKDV